MLEWKRPQIEDVEKMRQIIYPTGVQGSDASATNIFLLKEKYNIRIAIQDGFLFRSYTGTRLPGRNGVAFPMGSGDVERAVRLLEEDRRERGLPLQYIFLTEKEQIWLRKHRPGMICDEIDAGNTDYLYTAEHLGLLAGKSNHKKKNRVQHFMKAYPDISVQFMDSENFYTFTKDVIAVEEEWFSSQEERIDSSFVERLEIYDACKYFLELNLLGAVLYHGETPVAMSLASEISKGTFDIHFEKCFGDYARAGGFAAINQIFAKYLLEHCEATWMNREEDIGLAGLRRAKLSYHPDLMLEKFHTK